jgi:hypothetical protein
VLLEHLAEERALLLARLPELVGSPSGLEVKGMLDYIDRLSSLPFRLAAEDAERKLNREAEAAAEAATAPRGDDGY